MNQMKIVNYKSAKAYYNVEFKNDNTFVARLEKYSGDNSHMPPRSIIYIKESALEPESQKSTNSLLADVLRATTKG